MPPYLTFTTAKVKIKLPWYFFPNSHGCKKVFQGLQKSDKEHISRIEYLEHFKNICRILRHSN